MALSLSKMMEIYLISHINLKFTLEKSQRRSKLTEQEENKMMRIFVRQAVLSSRFLALPRGVTEAA